MWRFILISGVVLAVLLVLWSTSRLDKRSFIGASVALGIFALVFGFGAWQGSQQALVPISPENIVFTLDTTTALETGTRIKGNLLNNTKDPIAVVTLLIHQKACIADQCKINQTAELVIRRHLNVGSSAPVSELVRISTPKPHDNTRYLFEVTVKDAKGYRQAQGESGLTLFQ